MHELSLLINITIALAAAFAGGLVARRLRLPTIVGYLLAGVVIGPFTPGFVGDVETVSQLAELGVIFLMFGTGLHFSFADLWKVRAIAIPGALGQTLIASLLGLGLSQLWGWTLSAGIVLGLSISVASTVVLLRGLTDHSLLNTSHGQAAIGWLVMEDLLTVLILILMPAFAQTGGAMVWLELVIALAKGLAFALIAFFAGGRLVPWLLRLIVHTRSRELFILATLAVALGTALGSAALFGVSLALGAFVAGAVVSESPYRHQAGADLEPFREAFAVLFFVSVGMLVNPLVLFQRLDQVLALTLLIIAGKAALTVLLGLLLPTSGRTILVVAAGLSQIGEFSFILGETGLSLGMLQQDQYSLILAGALISITINPLMYRLIDAGERWLKKFPGFWCRLDRRPALQEAPEEGQAQHVVIVGYEQASSHLAALLESLHIPLLVVESDYEQVEELNRRGVHTVYGDAANSEVLTQVHLERARLLVIGLQNDIASEMVIAAAHDLAPGLPIIARALSEQAVKRFTELGVRLAVNPELEGDLEIMQRALLQLGLPGKAVGQYVDAVRQDQYRLESGSEEKVRMLEKMIQAAGEIEIIWLSLDENSPLAGQSLAETALRARTGASVVAVLRGEQLIANPKSATVFQAGDHLGLIGSPQQIEAARRMAAG